MTEDKIKELLSNYYKDKTKRQIVFWYDEEQDHIQSIDELKLDNVKIHKLYENNNFATKKLLENDDTESNYLIYAPIKKPRNEENWLLDIILYSQEFSPDEASIIANELKINDPAVKKQIKQHLLFFKNQDRYKKLAQMSSDWTEEKLEFSMMAVLAKVAYPNIENILQKVLIEGIDEDNKYLQEFKKYSLIDKFWNFIDKKFGYKTEKPNLKTLFVSIILTVLADKMKESFPTIWKNNTFGTKQNNSVVFINSWMRDRELYKDYNSLISELETELRLKENLKNIDENINNYTDCDIFEIFDRIIIKYIIEKLINNNEDYKKLKDIISVRKTKHWFNEFENIYKALESSIDLFDLMKKYERGFPSLSSVEMIKTYAKEYYRIDQAYRKFYNSFDKNEFRDSDILKDLQEKVENLYANKYLAELSKTWSMQIEQDLLNNWQIPGIEQQKDFYLNNVTPVIKKNQKDKVYVIISDAFRYECAEELVTLLNKESKIRGEAVLELMQGAIPSYTKLGMAALLPNKQIEITQGGDVLVDGMNTSDLPLRENILINAFKESKVVKYSKLKDLTVLEVKNLLQSARVVYVYHDQVDSRGDNSKTEKEVFKAVQEAFEDITDCVKRLVNNLSATNIYITSDHGFIYTRNPLEESDKVQIEKSKAIEEKKRFILTGSKPSMTGILTIDMNYILGKATDLKVIVPRGHHRFKTQGAGINFVHGGASLQEIVIPLIKFKSQKVYKQEKVEVKLTNSNRKITNNKFTLNFFQTEKVSDKLLARTLRVALYDGETQISDEKTVVADNTSDKAEDRDFKVILTLKNSNYDKNKDYNLKLMEDDIPYEEIPFKISLAFTNDFDF